MMTKTIQLFNKKGIIYLAFLTIISILSSCNDEVDNSGEEIIITPSPIAAFTQTADAMDWKIINFTDRSSNATTYAWDFGDDTNTSTDPEPTNTYAAAGSYTVTLTVGNGSDTEDTVEQIIVVLNPNAPIVAFTAAEDETDWKTFNFINQSEKATSYSWDFGDGNSSTEENPSHTYSGEENEMDYIVTLTATNDASGDFTSLEKTVRVINPDPVEDPTKKVLIFNPTFDDYTVETGDNADAWDMTPNSTVVDNDGNTIPSPYLWENKPLDSWLEGKYLDGSEQPSSTGDGNVFAQLGDRGVKLNEAGRRIYQEVEVEKNVVYTLTIDSRSEVSGINSEVYILNNTAMPTEDGLDANGADDPDVDAYFLIDNDFNSSKSTIANDTFTTNTFTFKPTTDKIIIYVRSIGAIDSDSEVFFDNLDVITPGFE